MQINMSELIYCTFECEENKKKYYFYLFKKDILSQIK